MLSRAASSIYWMSRYLERADNVARFLAVNAHLMLDLGIAREDAQWEPLVRASGDDAEYSDRYSAFSEKDVVHFLTFDRDNRNSIVSSVATARENARTLRDVISSEMWETINTLHHIVQKHSRKRRIDDLQDFFLQVRNASHLFTGYFENTMSHGEGWHFARLGKLLERADKTARLLDVKYFLLLPTEEHLDSPYDEVQWGAVLKSVSGFEMYLKQYHRANYRDVTQFLILDPHFPRAILHCIHSARYSLRQITKMLGESSPAEEEFAKLESMLADAQINNILSAGLHEFIDTFQFNLNVVDTSLYKSYFAFRESLD